MKQPTAMATLMDKIRCGQPVFGLFVSIPHPIIVEMIGAAEYDFVIIDCEHTTTSLDAVEEMVRAAELTGMTALVRIATLERTELLRLLDCGVKGIVIPHVEQVEQIEAAVEHAYYYPIGRRSLNSGRAGTFAKYNLQDYIRQANESIMIVPMIESVRGVQASREILAHPQVSFVLEGAADLSQSLGVPWQTEHPDVQAALDELQRTAAQCDVPYATVARSEADMARWADKGVRIFVLGDDRNTAFRAYMNKRSLYRTAGGWT
ncbi:HpcH/HpaI aldolase family protein [Paenibacillus campi]|uniref:HpcH/HpaI aldolase family protein n=1 Tax=Paenibacillus campi TaxID=3106031 RepID=UPI002AFDFE57|nr:aldolase/citrate lyase family protein [Paenibacillus sp. SGZ-1014]